MGFYPEEGSPLGEWLAWTLPGRRLTRAGTLAGGYRNDNTLLVGDDGQRYVLRRYRPHTAACAVEAALAERLSGVVPVAEVVAFDPTGAAAGQPVLLSRFVPGTLVSTLLPGLGTDDANQLGREVGRVLAGFGTVTFGGPGFFSGAELLPIPADGLELPDFVADCLARRHPDHELSEADCAWLSQLAGHSADLLRSVVGARCLVHADFNPKNLLAVRAPCGWRVTAVLDWEFAFSGSALFDVGNMLRFADDYPPGYADGFTAGFAEAGGQLPDRWREISRALDLYALADLFTRPPSDVTRRALVLLRRR